MPPLPGMNPGEWAASPWVQAPAALILWIAAFLVAKTIVLGVMRRVAARTPWTWDDILVESLSAPLLIAIVAMRRGADRDSTRMSSQVQGVLAATLRMTPRTIVLATRNAAIQRISAAGACTQGEAAHSPGFMPGSGGIAAPQTEVFAWSVIQPE